MLAASPSTGGCFLDSYSESLYLWSIPATCWDHLPEDTLVIASAGQWAGAEGKKAQFSSEPLVTGVGLANK